MEIELGLAHSAAQNREAGEEIQQAINQIPPALAFVSPRDLHPRDKLLFAHPPEFKCSLCPGI